MEDVASTEPGPIHFSGMFDIDIDSRFWTLKATSSSFPGDEVSCPTCPARCLLTMILRVLRCFFFSHFQRQLENLGDARNIGHCLYFASWDGIKMGHILLVPVCRVFLVTCLLPIDLHHPLVPTTSSSCCQEAIQTVRLSLYVKTGPQPLPFAAVCWWASTCSMPVLERATHR